MLVAHGVGTRSDLPIPTSFAAVGAALALVISFGLLALLWRQPRFAGSAAGRPLPRVLTRVADSAVVRTGVRFLALLALVLVCGIGFLGAPEPDRNLVPWVFYVTFWVGLVPASLLLGPVWRVLNPLRLLQSGLAWLLRVDRRQGRWVLPPQVGYWPAAVSLGVFAWFELAYPAGSEPRAVAVLILTYAIVHTGAGVCFGSRWFDRGDGFEVYSTLLGALAPIGRRADGRLALRNPLNGLEAIRPSPGLAGVVVVLVGSTAYDGLSRTLWWQTTVPTAGTVNRTLGLLMVIAAIAVIYLVGTWSFVAADAFAHTIVPIAAGYAIAHYFSLLVFDGQMTFILASDPLGHGADFLGIADSAIDYTLLGTTTIGLVQISAIVVGHLVAAISAHDRAVRLFPGRAALRTQLPLLSCMVVLTMGAVGLVFST